MVPAEKATNNVVVVCRLYLIKTLIQEPSGTRAYQENSTEGRSVANGHLEYLAVKVSVGVMESQDLQCTVYLIFTKGQYKARFIANSSHCTTTTELFKLLTPCLTAVNLTS